MSVEKDMGTEDDGTMQHDSSTEIEQSEMDMSKSSNNLFKNIKIWFLIYFLDRLLQGTSEEQKTNILQGMWIFGLSLIVDEWVKIDFWLLLLGGTLETQIQLSLNFLKFKRFFDKRDCESHVYITFLLKWETIPLKMGLRNMLKIKK